MSRGCSKGKFDSTNRQVFSTKCEWNYEGELSEAQI